MVRDAALTVRAAELTDAVAVGWLLLEGLRDAPSADHGSEDVADDPVQVGTVLLDRALRRDHRFLVAEVPEGVCGLARLAPRELLRSQHVADVDLLVHPVSRRLGVGAFLAGAAVRTAVEDPQIAKLSARVAADDAALRATLAASGPWVRERVERMALTRAGHLLDVEVWSLWVEGTPAPVTPVSRSSGQ